MRYALALTASCNVLTFLVLSVATADLKQQQCQGRCNTPQGTCDFNADGYSISCNCVQSVWSGIDCDTGMEHMFASHCVFEQMCLRPGLCVAGTQNVNLGTLCVDCAQGTLLDRTHQTSVATLMHVVPNRKVFEHNWSAQLYKL